MNCGKYFSLLAALGVAQGIAALAASSSGVIGPAETREPSVQRESQQGKSPVEKFRELLAAEPAERESLLAKDPVLRKKQMAKVHEYEALDPEERELRLQVTELRWYLSLLLNTPASERAARLAQVPPDFRELVSNRLRWWDMLPPPLQSQLLENEATIWYVTDLACRLTNGPPPVPKDVSQEEWEKLNAGLKKWQGLSEEQRRSITARFNQVFQLTPDDKQKTLRHLSEPERRQIERTLRAFQEFSPELRKQCLVSFERFNGLTEAERQQFLNNAARWKLMSPSQRESWKELVNHLSAQPAPPPDLPPLPPGFVPNPVQR